MIKSEGLPITEPSKIADTFNTFFSEIADEIRLFRGFRFYFRVFSNKSIRGF